MNAVKEEPITYNQLERLRAEVTQLELEVTSAERRIEWSIEYHQLAAKREQLKDRLAELEAPV